MNLKNTTFILFCLGMLEIAYGQRLWRSEVLGRPGEHSITVQLLFADSADVRVQYGTVSAQYDHETAWSTYADSVTVEIILSDLKPATHYFYRVNYRKPGRQNILNLQEHSFTTKRDKQDSFVFTVQADPHLDGMSDSALYRVCLKNQLEDRLDFMIDLGDFLMTDKLQNVSKVVPFDTIPYRCNLLRSMYESICHSVPLFIALGNHEGEAGWLNNGTANNIAVWDARERKRFFPNPYPDGFYTGDTSNTPFVGLRQSFYSWEWGNALFIVLDPYWYTKPKPDSLHGWNWTLGKAQYDWLRQSLENSSAEYKFVFAHQLIGGDEQGRGGVEFADLYEWGGKNLDGSDGWATQRPGWYKPIKDLLTENRVNIFFHGHDHFFGQQQKDCLIYQETPQPSLPNFNYPRQAADYGYVQGVIQSNTGHLRVSVNGERVKVEYVKAYRVSQETSSQHNKDVVATYFINLKNCYDSLKTGTTVIWNSQYADQIAYPNPFTDQTKISFEIKNTNHLTLDIFNDNGQWLRRLMDDDALGSGTYQVIWDGKDFKGTSVNRGNYYYKIQGRSNGAVSGKLIYLK